MHPPDWFLRALAILDPLLDVRRSICREAWVIERKAVLSPNELFYLRRRRDRTARWLADSTLAPAQLHAYRLAWLNLMDEVASAEHSYRVIIIVNDLTNAVFDMLCKGDLKRYGGYARFADDWEAAEARQANDSARVQENKRKAVHAEVFHILNFIEDKRSSALATGERDLHYLLHGQRNPHPDEPLIKLSEA